MPILEKVRIARHEAAHAIAALELGGTATKIDLNAERSPTGLGAAHVGFPDPGGYDGEERDRAILVALVVICAGAANDALELRETLQNSWTHQAPGDGNVAKKLLENLGIPYIQHANIIDNALNKAYEFVKAQRCAIISLGDLVCKDGFVRDKQIKRRYDKHKIV